VALSPPLYRDLGGGGWAPTPMSLLHVRRQQLGQLNWTRRQINDRDLWSRSLDWSTCPKPMPLRLSHSLVASITFNWHNALHLTTPIRSICRNVKNYTFQSHCIYGTPEITSPCRSIGVHIWSDFEIYEGHSPLIQLSQLNIHILNYLLILTNGIQIAIKIVGKCERSAPEFQLTEKVSKLIEWFARFYYGLIKYSEQYSYRELYV